MAGAGVLGVLASGFRGVCGQQEVVPEAKPDHVGQVGCGACRGGPMLQFHRHLQRGH